MAGEEQERKKSSRAHYLTDSGMFFVCSVNENIKRKKERKGLRSPALSLFNFAFHLTFCQRKIRIYYSSQAVVRRHRSLWSRAREKLAIWFGKRHTLYHFNSNPCPMSCWLNREKTIYIYKCPSVFRSELCGFCQSLFAIDSISVFVFVCVCVRLLCASWTISSAA